MTSEIKTEVPTGIEFIIWVDEFARKTRIETLLPFRELENELRVLGTAFSILYQAATCSRKCFGEPHLLEQLSGRAFNLASSAYLLIYTGYYDEALNLVRSMGEIGNLVSLSMVDPAEFKKWVSADDKTRITAFSPSKVRKLLAKHPDFLTVATKDWYSDFCERFTHATPHTSPNLHNEFKKAHIGGLLQVSGVKYSIEQLMTVCSQIALPVSRYTEMHDLFSELAESAKRLK